MRHAPSIFHVALAAILTVGAAAPSAHADAYIVFQDDRAGFQAAQSARSESTVIDSGGAFAGDPTLGSAASVTRTGTIAGQAFSYTAYDLQFSKTPTGTIAPGVVGGDVGALSSITTESPASQSGGVGSGSWGVDSGAVSTSRRSGLLVDFTAAPAGGIGHFGLDLIDFEASTASEGELRLYAAGLLVYSTTFALTPDGGNSSTHFLGVVANPANGGVAFDQAAVLVGSKTDRWAADRFTFGVARNPEPSTWALFGLGVLGLGLHLRRRRRPIGATEAP